MNKTPNFNQPNTISARMAAFRKKASLRQIELAEMLGVRVTTISMWENGRADNLKFTDLKRLAMALGVRVSELVGEAA